MTASNTNGGETNASGEKETPTSTPGTHERVNVHDIEPLDVDGAAGVDDADT